MRIQQRKPVRNFTIERDIDDWLRRKHNGDASTIINDYLRFLKEQEEGIRIEELELLQNILTLQNTIKTQQQELANKQAQLHFIQEKRRQEDDIVEKENLERAQMAKRSIHASGALERIFEQ